jgi:hypothetical protein
LKLGGTPQVAQVERWDGQSDLYNQGVTEAGLPIYASLSRTCSFLLVRLPYQVSARLMAMKLLAILKSQEKSKQITPHREYRLMIIGFGRKTSHHDNHNLDHRNHQCLQLTTHLKKHRLTIQYA